MKTLPRFATVALAAILLVNLTSCDTPTGRGAGVGAAIGAGGGLLYDIAQRDGGRRRGPGGDTLKRVAVGSAIGAAGGAIIGNAAGETQRQNDQRAYDRSYNQAPPPNNGYYDNRGYDNRGYDNRGYDRRTQNTTGYYDDRGYYHGY